MPRPDLVGHWALFVAFPGTEGPFLSKTTNIGAVIDKFVFGHINPGLLDHDQLRHQHGDHAVRRLDRPLLQSAAIAREKMRIIGDLRPSPAWRSGLLIHPWNPIIKRICTTSFTIYSTGWVLLMLLAFYWIVEVKGYTQVDLSADRDRRELDLHLLAEDGAALDG